MADEAPTYTVKQYREVHGKGLNKEAYKKWKAQVNALPQHKMRASGEQVPAKLNLMSEVSPPENQGSHGSCWDFAIIKALRSAWMLVGKDPGQLSFNYLICDGHTDYSCDSGGNFDAMDACLGGKGPWLAQNDQYPNCSGRCAKGQTTAATGKQAIQVGGDAPSFEQIADSNYQRHMNVIDVAVCGNWGSYGGGIFNQNNCGEGSIDHMINQIGYDCQTSVTPDGKYCVFNAKGEPVNGDGFLIVMNNWGTSWGEDGYMRTRAHVDAVASTVMYFTVDYTPPPPVPPVPPVPPTPDGGGIPVWIYVIIGALVAVIIGVVVAKKQAQPKR